MVKQNLLLPILVIWRTWLQGVILLISMSFLLFSFTGISDELDTSTLKAFYSYKLGKFTQWPEKKLNSATEKFKYCILGTSPFSQTTMDLIIGQPIQNIPLTMKVFSSGLIPEQVLPTCHILFISYSEKHRLGTIIQSLNNLPVLTVSDIPGFSNKLGMVTLTEKQGQVRFQINPLALKQANLFISSQIMKRAEIIIERQR